MALTTGGSLRIESLQDTESYKSRSDVKGGALASDVFKDSAGHKMLDKPYLSAETARGYTDSDYASVKEQAGIYAGQEGYDISVKDNTHLKGAVIDSKGSADKNTLRTGTLSWENIENKDDYTSGGSGISYTAKLGGSVNKDPPSSKENSRYDKEPGTNTHNESDKVTRASDGNRIPLNERGLLGVPSAATKGKADSTTRAAIAPGKIVITDTNEIGKPWTEMYKQGVRGPWGALGKYNAVGNAVGGIVDITGDFNTYSGRDLGIAVGIDTFKLAFGILGGALAPAPSIVISVPLDYGAYWIKQNLTITDREKQKKGDVKK